MKLITASSNESDIAEKSNFLRKKGILTSTSNENARKLGLPIRGELGLWVVINEQYQDAVECLNNPEHAVENPLSIEQMLELESAASKVLGTAIDSFANKLALFLVVAVIVGFLAYAFSSGT